jgi:thiol-disulfide isomerase/thioredoxin
MRNRDNKKAIFISAALILLLISPAFSADIVTSLKLIVESENIEATLNIFADSDNRTMSYQKFLSKLETGSWGYLVRRDERNCIVRISLVPWAVKAVPVNEPAVGDTAPIFNVVSADGREFSSANLRGKVVVIKFGSSQCGPCEEDWLQIRDIPSDFKDKPVVFLYMQIDGEQASVPGGSGYIAIGRQLETATLFDIASFPTHIVIDPEGIIRWKAKGAGRYVSSELSKAITSVIAEMINGG